LLLNTEFGERCGFDGIIFPSWVEAYRRRDINLKNHDLEKTLNCPTNYTPSGLVRVVTEAGFRRDRVATGSYELHLNLGATARKE